MASQWIIPRQFPLANSDEVHVWQVSLAGQDTLLEEHLKVLSEEEVVRARRFIRERDGARFAAMRSALRTLLAHYLTKQAASLVFTYGKYGKPDLESETIQFNVSHSGEKGLIAIHPSRHVGVDVERHREKLEAEKIAHRYFSPLEVEALFALPVSEQQSAFYRCWSRKEAYIKARGEGLSLGLDSFNVSLESDGYAALLNARGGEEEVNRWAVHALPMEEGYAGALFLEKPDAKICLYNYVTI